MTSYSLCSLSRTPMRPGPRWRTPGRVLIEFRAIRGKLLRRACGGGVSLVFARPRQRKTAATVRRAQIAPKPASSCRYKKTPASPCPQTERDALIPTATAPPKHYRRQTQGRLNLPQGCFRPPRRAGTPAGYFGGVRRTNSSRRFLLPADSSWPCQAGRSKP